MSQGKTARQELPGGAPSLEADSPISDASVDELGALVDDVLSSSKFRLDGRAAESRGMDARFHTSPRSGSTGLMADRPPVAPLTSPAAESEKASAPGEEWYLVLQGKQVGPFSLKTLEMLWDDGTLDPDVLCWRAGLPTWAPVRAMEELVLAFTRQLAPLEPKPRITETSGSWKPVGSTLLERLRREQVIPTRRLPPPPLPASPPDVRELIRTTMRELSPLLQRPPPAKAPVLAVAIASGVASGILVAVFFLVARPSLSGPNVIAAAPPPAAVASAAPTSGAAPGQSKRVSQSPSKPPAVVAQQDAVPAVRVLRAKPRAIPNDQDAFEKTFSQVGEEDSADPLPAKLELSEIMAVIVAHKRPVEACIREHAPPEGERADKLVMRWNIHPDGATSGIEVRTESLAGSALAACLERQIQKWTFPKHRMQGEPFEFPFRL